MTQAPCRDSQQTRTPCATHCQSFNCNRICPRQQRPPLEVKTATRAVDLMTSRLYLSYRGTQPGALTGHPVGPSPFNQSGWRYMKVYLRFSTNAHVVVLISPGYATRRHFASIDFRSTRFDERCRGCLGCGVDTLRTRTRRDRETTSSQPRNRRRTGGSRGRLVRRNRIALGTIRARRNGGSRLVRRADPHSTITRPEPHVVNVRILPEAEAETTEAAHWYNEQRFGLGDEFLAELAAAMASVVQSPESFALVETLQNNPGY